MRSPTTCPFVVGRSHVGFPVLQSTECNFKIRNLKSLLFIGIINNRACKVRAKNYDDCVRKYLEIIIISCFK